MNLNIAVSFSHAAKPPPIREGQLALSGKAAEYGDNVLRRLVGLIDDDHAAKHHSPDQRRVGVLDDAAFEGCLEQQLVDGGITVKLDVFSGSSKKLKIRRVLNASGEVSDNASLPGTICGTHRCLERSV